MLNQYKIKSYALYMVCLLFATSLYSQQDCNFVSTGQYMDLQTASQQAFTTYVAGPQQSKRGILLIHGWWGLNQEVTAWADQFAMAGYRVMALDLYNHRVTKDPVNARKLMNGVKQAEANEKYAAAMKVLSAPGRKIAVIGRSYGASQVLHAAGVSPEKVSAAIIYYPYGELITDKTLLTAIKSPILGHFASDDFFLTPDKVTQFTSRMTAAGLQLTANIYPAKHGFDRPAANNYNEAAHQLSLERSYQFLNKYLN